MKQTTAQVLLALHLKELGLKPLAEYRFCQRMWRFDLACPEIHLACEISGGNWSGGHSRGKAQEAEYDKLNQAQATNWKVFQFTNRQVNSGEAKQFIAGYLEAQCKIPAAAAMICGTA